MCWKQVGLLAINNSLQCFLSEGYVRRVYNGPQASSNITQLSTRTYATWTFLAGILRIYSAYSISDRSLYHASIWSFAIALLHFVSEWVVYKTIKAETGSLAAMITASVSFIWMVNQQGAYLLWWELVRQVTAFSSYTIAQTSTSSPLPPKVHFLLATPASSRSPWFFWYVCRNLAWWLGSGTGNGCHGILDHSALAF